MTDHVSSNYINRRLSSNNPDPALFFNQIQQPEESNQESFNP